jgi:hypothetical protein
MKLPLMTASRTVNPALAWTSYAGVGETMGLEGLQPAGIEDLAAGIANVGGAILSKVPCLALSCGANVLSCIYCGTNPVCWLTCAGPGAIHCVSECLSG